MTTLSLPIVRRRLIQLSAHLVVAVVARASARSAAAQGLGEATGRTLEDILVDVLRPGPGEAGIRI